MFLLHSVFVSVMFAGSLSAGSLSVLSKAMRLPRMEVEIENVQPCPENDKNQVQFKNIEVKKMAPCKYTLSGDIVIKETVDRPVTVVLGVYKCDTEEKEQCQFIFNYNRTDMCEMLEKNNEIVEKYTPGTDLPHKCPIQPRVYSMKNVAMDLDHIPVPPMLSHKFRVEGKVFKNDKLLMCLTTDVRFHMSQE